MTSRFYAKRGFEVKGNRTAREGCALEAGLTTMDGLFRKNFKFDADFILDFDGAASNADRRDAEFFLA